MVYSCREISFERCFLGYSNDSPRNLFTKNYFWDISIAIFCFGDHCFLDFPGDRFRQFFLEGEGKRAWDFLREVSSEYPPGEMRFCLRIFLGSYSLDDAL